MAKSYVIIKWNKIIYGQTITFGGDGLLIATMHPPPPSLNGTKFFGALGYTEHEIEC